MKKISLLTILLSNLVSLSLAQEWDDPITTSDWNQVWRSSFLESYNASNAPEGSGWFWGINMNHRSNSGTYKYNGQIAIKNDHDSPTMYFRSTNVNGQGTWAKVLFTSTSSIGNLSKTNSLQISGNNLHGDDLTFLQNTGSMLIGWNRSASHGETTFISNRGTGSSGGFEFRDISNSGAETVLLKLKGDGKVGIGTSSPGVNLDVNGSARFGLADENGFEISRFTSGLTDIPGSTGGMHFVGPINSHMVFDLRGNDSNDGFYVRVPTTLVADPNVNKTAFVVKASSKVGIATNSPENTLDVNGTARFGLSTDGGIKISRFTSSLTDVPGSTGGIQFTGPNNSHVVFDIKGNDKDDGFYVRVPTTLVASPTVDQTAFVVKADGKIGMGTSTPDSELTVAGNIHSQEVKVTVDAGADFVFADDYQLRSLEETEQFITENNHLPEIASADEMVENGLEIGEMNIKLLQKVEELTLYMIEMNKEMKSQKEEINSLKSENNILKSEIQNLKKK